MHCRALKYYFMTFDLIVITQGNKLSTSLFDYMYWRLFAFIQAIQEKDVGLCYTVFNIWLCLTGTSSAFLWEQKGHRNITFVWVNSLKSPSFHVLFFCCTVLFCNPIPWKAIFYFGYFCCCSLICFVYICKLFVCVQSLTSVLTVGRIFISDVFHSRTMCLGGGGGRRGVGCDGCCSCMSPWASFSPLCVCQRVLHDWTI